MIQAVIVLTALSCAVGFTPFSGHGRFGLSIRKQQQQASCVPVYMKLGEDEKILLVGVAADSGCGKSTFMRRLTKVFGGSNVGPLGGGFGNGGWETNTLVSDIATVLCLDDYHANDRQGRKVSGLTALNVKEQNFDLMAEQLTALKKGQSIAKPIYNHVNGTLDAPETVEPTKIIIIEGLHPLVDPRVRELLDFTIYLDISDEIKFAWKIQRDMAERGWTLEQVQADIEKRKPDFSSFVAPQMEFSDVVISVLPSELSKEEVGKKLKVKMIQKMGKEGLDPCMMEGTTSFELDAETKLSYCVDKYYNKDAAILEFDGKVKEIADFKKVESLLKSTGGKTATELSDELLKVGPNAPGSLDGTGLFQTITAFKLREFYEKMIASSNLISA